MGRRTAHQSWPVSLSIEMKITCRRIIPHAIIALPHAIIALPQATSIHVVEKKRSRIDLASGSATYALRQQFFLLQVVLLSEPSKSVFSHFTFPSDVVLALKTSGVPSAICC